MTDTFEGEIEVFTKQVKAEAKSLLEDGELRGKQVPREWNMHEVLRIIERKHDRAANELENQGMISRMIEERTKAGIAAKLREDLNTPLGF